MTLLQKSKKSEFYDMNKNSIIGFTKRYNKIKLHNIFDFWMQKRLQIESVVVHSPQQWQLWGDLDHKHCPVICNSQTTKGSEPLPTDKWKLIVRNPRSALHWCSFQSDQFPEYSLCEKNRSQHGAPYK